MTTICNINRKHLVKLLNLSKLSLRYNHSDSLIDKSNNVTEELSIKDTNDLKNNYDIS